MATTNPALPELTVIETWPIRSDPQERFDQKVVTAMNQISNLVTELNTYFVPKLNDIYSSLSSITKISNGGTGATTATQALSNLGGISKEGNRGELLGYELASTAVGSITITIESNDVICISSSGITTLTFTAGTNTQAAVKLISITATEHTDLVIEGAVFANNASNPLWGDAGTTLILVANFIGGRVVLSVFDNSQATT